MIEKLNILWTNDNRDTALSMILMYALNAKLNNWWETVNVMIWGASVNLVATDEKIQEKIKECQDAGVNFEACMGCTDYYGVTEQLAIMDIDVKYIGKDLTYYLKHNQKLITI
jgi:hypothetical protein